MRWTVEDFVEEWIIVRSVCLMKDIEKHVSKRFIASIRFNIYYYR